MLAALGRFTYRRRWPIVGLFVLGFLAALPFSSRVAERLSTGGFEFGYTMPELLAVELSLFSMTAWTDTTDEKNAYGMKAEVSVLAVTGLTGGQAAFYQQGE